MDLTRRELIRAAGISAAAGVLFAGCRIPERELIKQSPHDLPEDLANGLEDWYATACGLCSDGSGIIVRVVEGRAKKIEGNPDHPISRGKLTARCLAGVQALYHPDRLRGPQRARTAGSFEAIGDWEVAQRELVEAIRSTDASRTALITEPLRGHLGYVVSEFSKASGIQHMALETLETTVLRRAIRETFGQDRLPHFDIANTHYLLSFGADFLETWLSPTQYNHAYGEFRQGGKHRGTFVQVDSRFSMTAANADKWLAVKPGQEGILALSIAYVLIAEGLADSAAASQITGGEGAAALAAFAPQTVASEVSATPGAVTAEMIQDIARAFGENRPALAIAGGSTAAQANGLFNLNAAFTLNYLVGSVGVKGGVLFNPPPPLPELDGLGTAATYEEWKTLKERLDQGEVDLVLVHTANPVHGLASLGFGQSLKKAKTIVSFSSFVDETTALAHLVLPDKIYLEDWGTDVPDPGPGYQVLTLQQPIVEPVKDSDDREIYSSLGFGDLLLTAAGNLGLRDKMPWVSMEDLLRQRLQALHNQRRGSMQGATFEAFWVGILQRGGWWDMRLTEAAEITLPNLPEPVRVSPKGDGSYYLVPFSPLGIGDGSGAHLPWLQSTPDPLTTAAWQTWTEINSREAHRLGLREGDVVELTSDVGTIRALAYLHPGVPPGVIGIPLGQGHTHSGRWAEGRGVNPLAILEEVMVQNTGALAWAATRVRLSTTGQRVRIPKFEGTELAQELEGASIVQITSL